MMFQLKSHYSDYLYDVSAYFFLIVSIAGAEAANRAVIFIWY